MKIRLVGHRVVPYGRWRGRTVVIDIRLKCKIFWKIIFCFTGRSVYFGATRDKYSLDASAET